MPQQVTEFLEILNTNSAASIRLDGDSADIISGGAGSGGELILRNAEGSELARVDGEAGAVILSDTSGNPIIRIDGPNGTITILNSLGQSRIRLEADTATGKFGGEGEDGDLKLYRSSDDNARTAKATIHLDGGNANVKCGGSGRSGNVLIRNAAGLNRIRFEADTATGRFGGNGNDGDLTLYPSSGDNETTAEATIHLDGGNANVKCGGNGRSGDVLIRNASGENRIRFEADTATGRFGGNGNDGDLTLYPSSGDNNTTAEATIHLDGGDASVICGGNGRSGDVLIRNTSGEDRIRLNAKNANGWFGGNGKDGDLMIFDETGDNRTSADATIRLNGGTGDIILQNADCAEDFDVIEEEDVDPGTVMVMHKDGVLHPCDKAYDRSVAGVISGAGAFKPGLILDRHPSDTYRMPVALMGKVYCKVDATSAPIRAGDRLTTSLLPGHAMRVSDEGKANGAIIGKALKPLSDGTGLIPILVTLQ